MFIPRNEYEEMILLLLISEAMAVRDAVLSQSPEFKEARIHAFENATAVYDLLTVVVVKWSQVDLLHEVTITIKFSRKNFILLCYCHCFLIKVIIIWIINLIIILCHIVFRESDEILTRGSAYMDAVRIMPSKHGKIHACVQSFKSSRQTIASESNALSIGRKVMLWAIKYGKQIHSDMLFI